MHSHRFVRRLIHLLWVCVWSIPLTAAVSLGDESRVGTLEIEVSGLKSDHGSVLVVVFDSEASYRADDAEPVHQAQLEILGGRANISFDSVPYGTYAVKIFHDANANEKLDTNWIGIPKESIGFSNNVMGRFGPPGFDKAKFELAAPTLKLEIEALDIRDLVRRSKDTE
jgi:uncharacterized protein (DUF2141 family)